MSSLTVKKPTYESQYYLLWMWSHSHILRCGCFGEHTDFDNSLPSCSRIHNTVIAGHSWQCGMNGPSSSTSWKFQGISDSGPSGCRNGIQLICVMLSLSTVTCSIIWVALCELLLRRRLIGWKTSNSQWRLRERPCQNSILKYLQWWVCLVWQHTCFSLTRSCDRLELGQGIGYSSQSWDYLYYQIPRAVSGLCGEWILCQA